MKQHITPLLLLVVAALTLSVASPVLAQANNAPTPAYALMEPDALPRHLAERLTRDQQRLPMVAVIDPHYLDAPLSDLDRDYDPRVGVAVINPDSMHGDIRTLVDRTFLEDDIVCIVDADHLDRMTSGLEDNGADYAWGPHAIVLPAFLTPELFRLVPGRMQQIEAYAVASAFGLATSAHPKVIEVRGDYAEFAHLTTGANPTPHP